MRILRDECLPKRLKRDLAGHEARTVPEMGWASRQNGDLLTLAEHQFDVFLTVDRTLSFQQHVNKSNLAVVVMVAKGNRHAVQPLVADVLVSDRWRRRARAGGESGYAVNRCTWNVPRPEVSAESVGSGGTKCP